MEEQRAHDKAQQDLHGRKFYDKDAEAGMQKGTLFCTADGCQADLGQGPEADQMYTQAEAQETVDAFLTQHAKETLTRLTKEKLQGSAKLETAVCTTAWQQLQRPMRVHCCGAWLTF
jgi:hypothetical protein